jgi:ATP-dependent DNA helicase RecG
VIGNNPPAFVGGAYIQFVRFQGTELADDIRNQKEVRGPLPDLMRRIDEILEANIEVATSITEGPREIRRPDYPLAALQQLIRYAVLHRSYQGTNAPVRCYWFDDRIEIHSPGGAYGRVTAENFGDPDVTDYRNPPPEFNVRPSYVLATVRKRPPPIAGDPETLLWEWQNRQAPIR